MLTTRIKSDLPYRIKKQVRRVNVGQNVEMDYPEYRRLQGMLAEELMVAANGAAIRLTPTTLRGLNKLDFSEGETIRVSKCAIECRRRQTTAWNVQTFKDLQAKDMPQYLRVFIGG